MLRHRCDARVHQPSPVWSSMDAPQHNDQHALRDDWVRGGSAAMPENAQSNEFYHSNEETIIQPPKVLLKHVTLALRLTCEWNRRLQTGVKNHRIVEPTTGSRQEGQKIVPPSSNTAMDYSGTQINPTSPWHLPMPNASPPRDEEVTLFHAKSPRRVATRSSAPRGVAYWGPDLHTYLERLLDLLDVSNGFEVPLAMIYLDRCSSVETLRSNGIPPCPFCTPRTVHRLILTALLLATQATHGWSDNKTLYYYEKLTHLGIPSQDIHQMVEWMRGALGDEGLAVTVAQLQEWGHKWDSVFFLGGKPRIPHTPVLSRQPPTQQQYHITDVYR